MAAAITLVATTAEQQAFELLIRIRNAVLEAQSVNPANALKGFEITNRLEMSKGQAIFSISLPLVQSNTSGGGLRLDADWVWGGFPLLINGQAFTINGVPVLL